MASAGLAPSCSGAGAFAPARLHGPRASLRGLAGPRRAFAAAAAPRPAAPAGWPACGLAGGSAAGAARHAGRRGPAPARSSSSFARENYDETGTTRSEAPTAAASEEAHETIAAIVARFRARELDALLELVPDDVIDAVIARRKASPRGRAGEALRFADVLDTAGGAGAGAGGAGAMQLDTFALRTLVFSTPASVTPLSSLMLGGGRFVQRCLVRSATGEEAVLTFVLVRQDVIKSQYRRVVVGRLRRRLRLTMTRPL